MTHTSQPQHGSEYEQALSTLGMRIRKLVADGYMVPKQQISAPQRQPLPDHISQPPSLTNQYSTFESGSNLSEWQNRPVRVHTLGSETPTKRKLHDDESEGYNEYVHPQYGSLSFNEEF